jgi:hypothetical protein
MSTKILAALGVESEEHALQAIERFNLFLTQTRAEAAADSFDGVVTAIKDGKALASVVAELTGKTGPEAIGALHALKAQADAFADAKARLDAVEAAEAKAAQERARAEALASIDASVSAGRLTPAAKDKAVALLDAHGVTVLAAFLDALPVVVVAPPAPAPLPTATASETPTDEEFRRMAEQFNITEAKARENWARFGAAAQENVQ